MTIRVRVKYIFGLRQRDGDSECVLELPDCSSVFQILQELGLSHLELLPAINGERANDSTRLQDGDELVLIPAIQGGCG